MTETRDRISQRVHTGQPLDHIPVIDFHCHLGASSEYYYIPRSRPQHVIAAMDRFGIDHIVTFAINTTTDPGPGNRLQYAAARAHPDRISALTMLHAAFPQDWHALLQEGFAAGSRGIKLITQYQGVDETGVDWSEAFEVARDRHWVVLHHHWGPVERLERWAKTFPQIIFIVGHATTEYSKVVEKYDNVYQCTCACFVARHFASVEKMVQAMPAEKILYGSDALDLDFGTGIGPIALADLPERTKELILGRNALTLFKTCHWPAKV